MTAMKGAECNRVQKESSQSMNVMKGAECSRVLEESSQSMTAMKGAECNRVLTVYNDPQHLFPLAIHLT